ncbi:DNA-binding MarR family transcriptional regulator [Beijerinckia sp. GAS462]|nr:DNA-binding MarR family transcriptional regulator [Beijerinckia sp. GAS462]SEC05968.1 transcriptional regulator, MarR family [Beijerinckia sp. 28-YEA-48]
MARQPSKPQASKSQASKSMTVDPSDRMAHLVKLAGKALVRALQMRLAQISVAHGHWTFLRVLWQQDGLSQVELGAVAGVTRPSTSAAVKAMEELGYVELRQQKGNRKNVYVFLTAAGRALERKLVPLAVDVNKIALEGFSAADEKRLRSMLLKITENLAEDEVV